MTQDLMPWFFLSTAILFEVAGITAMKLSRGFTEPVPSLAVLVFYVLSAGAVILALTRLDLSLTYAGGRAHRAAALIGVVYFANRSRVEARIAELSSWASPAVLAAKPITDARALPANIGAMDGLIGQSDGLIRFAIFAGVFLAMALIEFAWPKRELLVSKRKRWLTNLGISATGTLLLRLMTATAAPIAAIAAAFYAEAHGLGLLNQLAWPPGSRSPSR
jgi:multidrug transporter EmrE-like cation transporter